MTKPERSTKYVRDSSGRVILQRDNKHSTSNTPLLDPKSATQNKHSSVARSRDSSIWNVITSQWTKLLKRLRKVKKYPVEKFKSLTIFNKLLTIVIVSGALILMATYARTSNNTPVVDSSAVKNQVAIDNLEYQTLLPKDRDIASLGGWRRVSPPNSDPVYTFTDRIGNVTINVSQQPIPNSLTTDANKQVAKLAKEYNASTILNSLDTKVFLGSSSKGPQSVIFTRNNLLILIKSEQKISDSDWIAYINNLQ